MNVVHNCDKLKKGESKFVIPTSYIVMIKQHSNMSDMVSTFSIACMDYKFCIPKFVILNMINLYVHPLGTTNNNCFK